MTAKPIKLDPREALRRLRVLKDHFAKIKADAGDDQSLKLETHWNGEALQMAIDAIRADIDRGREQCRSNQVRR